MPSKQQQANREIHEDQLLNFLVNTLDEELTLDLGANAEIDAVDIGLYSAVIRKSVIPV